MPALHTVCLCFLLIAPVTAAKAQEPVLKKRDGEHLPPGAFARIGDMRFRIPGSMVGSRFIDGGKKLLVRVSEPTGSVFDEVRGTFRLFDLDGMALARITSDVNNILSHFGSSGPVKEGIVFSHWAVSPDGTLLANVAGWPIAKLKVHEITSGKVVIDLASKDKSFSFVQFLPDGKSIAAAEVDHSDKEGEERPIVVICIYDLQSGKRLRTFAPPLGQTETFQAQWFTFSADGKMLAATGYEDGKSGIVRVWDVAGKRPSWRLEGHTEKRTQPRAIAFSPDGKSLAAVHDGKLKLWAVENGARVKDVAEFKEHCTVLDFAPDGKHIIASSNDPNDETRMWNLATDKEVPLPTREVGGYVFFNNGDNVVLDDTSNQQLVICSTATGQVLHKIDVQISRSPFSRSPLEIGSYHARQGMGWPFAISDDGKTLVACVQAGQIRRFDTFSGKEFPAPGMKSEPAPGLAFAPDGKKLLAASNRKVVLHDLQGKISPLELPIDLVDSPARNERSVATAYSNDGKSVAVGIDNGSVYLWDTSSGKLKWKAKAHELAVSSLSFTSNSNTLMSTGYYDGRAVWWNVSTGKATRTFARDFDKELFHRGRFWIGPNGFPALFGHQQNKTFEEIELSSGRVRQQIAAYDFPLAASPDRRFFLVSGWGCYRLVDSIVGREIRSFAHVDSEYKAIDNPHGMTGFSSDSRTLVGAAGRDVVRVWDTATATLLATLPEHDGGVLGVAISSDGETIATSAGDGTILLWRTPKLSFSPVTAKDIQPPKALRLAADRKDLDGNLLPDAARTRLGLQRFQCGIPISGLRYTGDGRFILAQVSEVTPRFFGNFESGLMVWNAQTGKLENKLHIASDYDGPQTGIPREPEFWTVSNDGKLVATSRGGMRVLEIATGKVVYQAKVDKKRGPYCFAPDSKTIFDVSSLTLIDLDSGLDRKLPEAIEIDLFRDVQFSPDGKWILLSSYSGELELLSLKADGKKTRLAQKLAFSSQPAFSPDSRRIALMEQTDRDKKPRLLVIDTETRATIRDLGEHEDMTENLFFSPDGKLLVAHMYRSEKVRDTFSFQQHSTIRRWDLATGKELPAVKTEDVGHAGFTTDSRFLAVSDNSELRLIDAATGQVVRSFPIQASSTSPVFPAHGRRLDGPFALSSDGKKIAVVSGHTLRQFELDTGKEIGPTPISQSTFGLSVAKNGEFVASLCLDQVQLWNANDNKVVLYVMPWHGADKKNVSLTCVALAADGRRLAVGGSDGAIAFFDVNTKKADTQFRFHVTPIASLEFSEEGATLVSSDVNANIAYWSCNSGELLRKQTLPDAEKKSGRQVVEVYKGVFCLQDTDGAFELWDIMPFLSSKVNNLVVPKTDTVELIDLSNFKRRMVDTKAREYGRIVISNDGKHLVFTERWHEVNLSEEAIVVHIVDLASGKEIRAVANFSGIRDISISPDGMLLAACGTKGLRIWDVATGTLQVSFNGHRGTVTHVAFSPDGGALVSAADDGTMLVWDVAVLLAKQALLRHQQQANINGLIDRDGTRSGQRFTQFIPNSFSVV